MGGLPLGQRQGRHRALYALQAQRAAGIGSHLVQRSLQVTPFHDAGKPLDLALPGIEAQAFLYIATILVMIEAHVVHGRHPGHVHGRPDAQPVQQPDAGW